MLVFKGSDGGTIPERDGAISKVFLFFFFILNKSQCKSKKDKYVYLQFLKIKGTRGTYCTGEGGVCME